MCQSAQFFALRLGARRRLAEQNIIRMPPHSGGVTRENPSGGSGFKPQPIVSFDRREFSVLLNVYGRKVAAGEWRDYAMDMLRDRALFSVYRRTSECPQFVVEKNPKLRNRQGQYTVTNAAGRVLKRGHDLEKTLRVLEPQVSLVR